MTTDPPHDSDLPYIKLDPDYTKNLTWSNDPRDLDLHGAFSLKKPNLSSDYDVDGLQPILKEEDGEDPWILQDAEGMFYLWDPWTSSLYRVTENWTKGPGLKTIEDVVDNILTNLIWVEDDLVRVFRTDNKATEGQPLEEDSRYIKLKAEYTHYLTWSNDPTNLDLHGAFREVEPNLSSDYNVKDLQPILKEKKGDIYLLKDTEGTFYVWDMWDGLLLRVAEEWTIDDDLDSVEKVVDNNLCNLYLGLEDSEKVFRT